MIKNKKAIEIIAIAKNRNQGTYSKSHTPDQCDSCLEDVGIYNLHRVPFLYKDMNDNIHNNLGHGYRQYYVCDKCKNNC